MYTFLIPSDEPEFNTRKEISIKMKKRFFSMLLLLLLLLATSCAPAAAPAAAPTEAPAASEEPAPAALARDLVVLYTNDVHCGVDDNIGYAGLAALKKQFEASGCDVVLADCGDALQGAAIGTLSKGESIVKIMNGIGYDVATIGNHEFDYGAARMLELAELAEYPYVCCNFRDLTTGEPLFPAYEMMEFNGVKVAFIGVATPKTITSSAPVYFQNDAGEFIYAFDQDADGSLLYASVQSAVDEARGEGANYVIVLSHLGIDASTSPWTSSELIEATAGIDVVLDGHSHSVVPCERVRNKAGEWVLLSQTGTKLQNVGMLLIETNGNISTGLISAAEPDAEAASLVDAAKAEFDAMLQQVVAKTDVALTIMDPEQSDVRIIRRMETNLGDLCADAYRILSGADVAVVNGGGIRSNIAPGDITYEQIIAVHPFGNALCVIEATGQEILDLLELGASALPDENGGFMQVSGLSYEIDTSVPSTVELSEDGLFQGVTGARRVQNVLVGGEPLDPDKTYTLASHDYLIKNGGDGYAAFQDNVLLQDCIMLDNQVLINYLVDALGGVVGEEYAEPYGQGRIVIR